MAKIYNTRDGDMLDAICHRYYGHLSGVVEAVLEANPGLAAQGEIYSAGTFIQLPELPPASHSDAQINIWD